MPPQQTNVTSETERDAAALGADLPTALAKDAMDEALAAPHLNYSIARLDDAFAAGPTTALTRSVLSLLRRSWHAFQERRQRQSLRAALSPLSDRELMDIGLTRDEIDYITPQRAIDRLKDGMTDLWGRGLI
jgi:uncharacterized protein YjiS (DUF1127 family)